MSLAESLEQPAAPQPVQDEDMASLAVADNNEVAQCDPLPTLDQIKRLQAEMIRIQCEQPKPNHFFAPGMYLRELTVPAGMLIVGKIHKHAHFLMVLRGRAEVVSAFGRMFVEAGHISISPPGVKRVVLALEDTQFVTVHVNKDDSQDLAVIEAEHIEPELVGVCAGDQREVLQ
jgi:mannose-6-phosphate isomerase-like protein (cupin superfamily)